MDNKLFLFRLVIMVALLVQLGYLTATAHPDDLSMVRDGTVWVKMGFVLVYALAVIAIIMGMFFDVFNPF